VERVLRHAVGIAVAVLGLNLFGWGFSRITALPPPIGDLVFAASALIALALFLAVKPLRPH